MEAILYITIAPPILIFVGFVVVLLRGMRANFIDLGVLLGIHNFL